MDNLKTAFANRYFKTTFFFSFFIFTFVAIFSKPVMKQDLNYHLFADQRLFLGIPNFFDVLSNFIFIVVGFWGMVEAKKKSHIQTQTSWMLFFLSIFLVAPGSMYYHWGPENLSLVWDRLPMGAGFMILYCIVLSEFIDLKFQRWLPAFAALGIFSVILWHFTDDLRLYTWIQLSAILSIPAILAIYPSSKEARLGYMFCFLFYILAKITELFDRQIYTVTNQIVSGHTLKHLLAGAGIYFLVRMICRRNQAINS